jgi:TRAP-type mannitol/chloroaromatic compound transport system permease small subunit
MSRLSDALDRWVSRLSLGMAWLALISLMALMLFHVIGRQFRDVSSEALAELGADLFFGLVMFSFGYAYLRDGHVRVDVFRDRLPARWIAWMEILGCLTILMPLSSVLILRGWEAAWLSLVQGERPSALTDLPVQWIVKATVPIGFLLLLLSALCVTMRNVLFLVGREPTPAPHTDEEAPLALAALVDRRPDGGPA